MDRQALKTTLQTLDADVREQLLSGDFHDRVARVDEVIRAHREAVVGREALDELCPVRHSIGHGFYQREMTCPAGVLSVTKIHKEAHPFFVVRGDVSMLTPKGVVRLKGGDYGITPKGTQRVCFTHAETVFVTTHQTDLTDPDEIEDAVTTDDIAKLDITPEELAALKGETSESD